MPFLTKIAPLALLAAFGLSLASPAAAQAPFQITHFMVGLSVADIEKETAWFVDKLGFKVEKEAAMGAGGGKVRFIVAGNERIELISTPGSKPGPARGIPPAHAAIHGYAQLTMEVPDLDAARAALASKGVKPGLDITPIPPLGIRIMFLADPEGNLVELVQKLKP